MGVGPSSEYTFCVFCTPVGSYFKSTNAHDDEGSEEADKVTLQKGEALPSKCEIEDVALAPPISLRAMKRYHRAAEGMTGGIKASGNYAPCFKASKEVKSAGFNEVNSSETN